MILQPSLMTQISVPDGMLPIAISVRMAIVFRPSLNGNMLLAVEKMSRMTIIFIQAVLIFVMLPGIAAITTQVPLAPTQPAVFTVLSP
jgi:hypothetical protein